MTVYVNRSGLQVASALAEFVEAKALPGTGVQADALWQGLADILPRLVPVNRALMSHGRICVSMSVACGPSYP